MSGRSVKKQRLQNGTATTLTEASTSTAPHGSDVSPTPGGDDLVEDFILEDQFAQDSDGDVPADSAPGTFDNVDLDDPAPEEAKKDKKKQKKKKARTSRLGMDEDIPSIAFLPPEYLADKLLERQSRVLSKLSSLELQELQLAESTILDTSAITSRSDLSKFILETLPAMKGTLAKVPKLPGAPRILVLSGAALRVADLCRQSKTFQTKEIHVGKLFAKHFKLQEHVEYLKTHKVGIAVGTPNRIGKLLESDAMNLTYLSHIVLDVSHIDSKKRTLLDIPEAADDLFKLVLANATVLDRLNRGIAKIVFY